ncbi:sulfatase [Candidatus Litorirhabdus singularis]|nr:sulfatase [Candidatus Litorirhabdus singularis]
MRIFISVQAFGRCLSATAVAVLFSLGAAPLLASAEVARPNILLLMAEDLSPRIGAYGDPVAITPNLDQLALQGVRYTNAYTASGVCATNRAATITGMAQESMGGQHMRAYTRGPAPYRATPPPQVKAFPELLRAAGYYTFTSVKLDYQFSGPLPGWGPNPFTIWDRAERSSKWQLPPEQPFFGYMNFGSTHESGVFPRWVWPRSMAHLMAQISHIMAHWDTEDQVFPEDVEVPPYYPDTLPMRTDIARYYNNIITMDSNVGEVLQQLELAGLADDTIVIWTTDHGDGLPRAKRELYDSGLQVPFIIRWPQKWRPQGVEPGSVETRMISFVDLAPTILSLAGVPIPEFIQGRAFAGPGAEAPRQYVFAARDRIDEVADRQRAVRDKRYKYIKNYNQQAGGFHLGYRDTADGMRELWRALAAGELNAEQRQWFEPRPPEYLFDTQSDPFELQNLAADPAYAQILQRLRDALARHKATITDYSDSSEAEMAERFWPGGEEPVTKAVEFNLIGDSLVLQSATTGASIGYRHNGGDWRLYTGPLNAAAADGLEAKAVRYGWAESAASSPHR